MFDFKYYYYIFIAMLLFGLFKFVITSDKKNKKNKGKYNTQQKIFIIISIILMIFPSIKDDFNMINFDQKDEKIQEQKIPFGDIKEDDHPDIDERDKPDEAIATDSEKEQDLEEVIDKDEYHENVGNEVLKVHFIDIGQGDSALVESPNGTIGLIDGGPGKRKQKLMTYLDKNNIEHIDYIIATHPHEDHIGGLPDVINKYNVKEIYMPNITHTTKVFERLLMAIKNNDVKLTLAEPDLFIENSGGVKNQILHPEKESKEDKKKNKNFNMYSIINRIEYGDVAFMFTGDAEIPNESDVLRKYSSQDLKSDVLKVGHHGSTTSTSDMFLDAVDPSIAVLSYEKGNSYGHPHSEIVKKLKGEKIEIFSTEKDGNILIITDGKNIETKVKN